MKTRACSTIAVAALVLQGGAAFAAPKITIDGTPTVFRVSGSDLLAARAAAGSFDDVFQVGVDNSDLVPMAGSYEYKDGTLTFRPQFPLDPGVYYRAKFNLGAESAVASFSLPKPVLERSTTVTAVYPSVSVLPQNQLKLYIHFSDGMTRGGAFQRIHIRDSTGAEVQLPFLSLAEELWDGELKRLTVLFDPGRIKRGLVPNRDLGLALMAGRTYTLTIDEDWVDGRGAKLKASFSKTFTVGPEDRTPLDPANWVVTAPAPGTATPLSVKFPEALDHALLSRVLSVKDAAGKTIEGEIAVSEGDSRWSFTPTTAWSAGRYEVSVPGLLEDLAGNKVYTPFDVDNTIMPNAPSPSKIYSVPFVVGRAN